MFLVKKDGLIYEVRSPIVLDGKDLSLKYTLELICGFDYIDPDYSDIQGWVCKSRFTERVQEEDIMVLFDESLKERLDSEGYKLIKSLPSVIHTISSEE